MEVFMNKWALVFFAASILLGATGCHTITAPPNDYWIGTYDATKAEFVSVANPNLWADLVAQGWTVVLEINANTLTMQFQPTGDPAVIATGTWSASGDVLTVNWTSGFSGESEFDYIFNSSGSQLTLTGGHVSGEIAFGNPAEAILNLILEKGA
jgi:hypothetical protein